MKKIILLLCFIAMVGIVKSQDKGNSSLYQWKLQLTLDLPELTPEAIQWSVIEFDPTEKFIEDFNKKSIENGTVGIAMEIGWDKLFKEVQGDKVYLLTNSSNFSATLYGETDFVSNDQKPVTKKWLISKTFKLDGKPYCFAVPLNTENGAKIGCVLDKNNMISLWDIYKSNIEPKK